MTQSRKFGKAAKRIAFDEKHRQTIKFNIGRYNRAVELGMLRYKDVKIAKNIAARIKREVLLYWDEYLLEFEKNITTRGVKVLWAIDANEARKHVESIIKEKGATRLVKSKSMTTEEIELNEAAKHWGCESVETDLGEFIVQVAEEKPYHIVTPAMHKSKEDIASLFHQKFNTPLNSSPEELTKYVRQILRNKYLSADIGVTGANFLIADIGGISITENEGNGLMSTSFPKTHIVIAGIEKIIPKMSQLGIYYPLLAAHGTGQQVTAYNSIITGPRKHNEVDGPEEMIVILLDNGRTNIYEDDEACESLSCIRCGACLNACPVYKTIGGYAYNCTYSGPIGSVITPHLNGFKAYGHLSFASSLCGKCAEVCPVKIPLPDILLSNRKKIVEQNLRPKGEKLIAKGFEYITRRRSRLNSIPTVLKNYAATPFNYIWWGPNRKMPHFTSKSFTKEIGNKHKYTEKK